MTGRIDDADDATRALSIHGARRAAVFAARVVARSTRRPAAQSMLLRLLRRRTRWPRAGAGRLTAWAPVLLYWGRTDALAPRGGWAAPGHVTSVAHRHWHTALPAGGATVVRTMPGTPAIAARVDVRMMTPLRPWAQAAAAQRTTSAQARIVAPGPMARLGRQRRGIGRMPAAVQPARAAAAAPTRQAALPMALFAGSWWSGRAELPARAGSVAGIRSAVTTRAVMARHVAPASGAHPPPAMPVRPRASAARIGLPPSGQAGMPVMAAGSQALMRPGRAVVASIARSTRARVPPASPWPDSGPRAVRMVDAVWPAAAGRPTAGVARVARALGSAPAHATRPGAAASVASPPALYQPAMRQPAMRQPLELVWTAGASDPQAAGLVHRTGAAPAKMPAAATGVTVMPAHPEPDRARDADVARATALDPLLTNRLADEVMRRIDRRARIERERRGN